MLRGLIPVLSLQLNLIDQLLADTCLTWLFMLVLDCISGLREARGLICVILLLHQKFAIHGTTLFQVLIAIGHVGR